MKYTSPEAVLRVWVRRMNITRTVAQGAVPMQYIKNILWHYISHPNQLSIIYVPKSAKSDARTGQSALTMLKMG